MLKKFIVIMLIGFSLHSNAQDFGDKSCGIFIASAKVEKVSTSSYLSLNAIVVVKNWLSSKYFMNVGGHNNYFNVLLMKPEAFGIGFIPPSNVKFEPDRIIYYFSQNLGVSTPYDIGNIMAVIGDPQSDNDFKFRSAIRIFDNNEIVNLTSSTNWEHLINHCN